MFFSTINPANEKIISNYLNHTVSGIDNEIEKSYKSYKIWKKYAFNQRGQCFLNASKILNDNKQKYAELMALEMGKPLAQGIAEIEKCIWVCEYYAENAEELLRQRDIKTEKSKSYVIFEPLGVLLAIMPWNFPFWQVFRFAVPNLMAGNTAVLKHSPNTAGCSMEISNIFKEAGFPEGIFGNIFLSPESVPEFTPYIIQNRKIMGVSLTGSMFSGSLVAALAGSLIKKTVLELGGSDPYIVLEDADLEKAADYCVTARMSNTGQTCIAAKRFIVDEKIINDFTDLFIEKSKSFIYGNPLDSEVKMGPMARGDLRQRVHEQVQESVQHGSKLLLGGFIPEGKGFYYPPTVLTNVKRGNPAFYEEIFGPVASIISYKTIEEAIELANDTPYGLGAAIFSKDIDRAERIAREDLIAGSCFVNEPVKSDPRLPFGGIKNSGFGRELGSFGITEFMNIKTVVVA